MPDKTVEQLQAQIDLDAKLKAERKVSDDAYAAKLVERIVYGVLTLLAAGIVTAIFNLALKHVK